MKQPLWLVVLVAAGVAFLVSWLMPRGGGGATANDQLAYERVMRTRTLRCGYVLYPRYLMRDPNTGKFSGIFYELTEAMGRALNLKIEWTAETNYTVLTEELRTGRYDIFAGGFWPEAARSGGLDFSMPVTYVGIGICVRPDDHRFDRNWERINQPDVRISTLDGEMGALIAATEFPRAKTLSLPQNAEMPLVLENIVAGKADVAFVENAVLSTYLEQRPGTLRNIAAAQPLRIFGNTFALAKKETALRDMLNAAICELSNNRVYQKIEAKYAKPGDFYPVALPYQQK